MDSSDSQAERARTQAAAWLVLLDDDPGDATHQAEFRAWLAADPAHAAAWEGMSRTGELLARADGVEEASPTARPPGRARVRVGRWVAAGLLAAGLAFFLAPAMLLQIQADHATGTAQIETLQLADGSAVRLGPDSALKLDFSGGERRVTLLSGEALFDVAHDAQRPFRVVTADATTTVLGTRFDVALLAGGTSVAVVRGHVQVDARAGGASFDLLPGDWVRVGGDGKAERGSDPAGYLIFGQDGRLAVRNRPVAEVVARLRPWFSGRIVIADGDVGHRPVTGVFDLTDPAGALEALVAPQGGRVTRVTPWLLIVTKG
ncbi:MAG: FecR family protein [Pseudomonadota bacterium]